jgi:peptidoglycan/xylan/chitin deacetylase (PgdA/CDA1 family)
MQLNVLSQLFDIVTPETLESDAANGGYSRSSPKALITFDDGFRDNWTRATPILEEFAVPALLFAAGYPIRSSLSTFLSEEQLRELASHPRWSVGAHGDAHLSLTSLAQEDVERDIDQCRGWLTEVVGENPDYFAYPYGKHSGTTAATIAERFRLGFIVGPKKSSPVDAWHIPRLLVTHRHASEREFIELLATGTFAETHKWAG